MYFICIFCVSTFFTYGLIFNSFRTNDFIIDIMIIRQVVKIVFFVIYSSFVELICRDLPQRA